MLSIESVEFRIIRRAVFGTVPPAPITSLSSQQRFLRVLQRGFRWRAVTLLLPSVYGAAIGFAGVPKEFPRSNIFAVPDPDIEIRINPGRGENPRIHRNIAGCGNRFGRSEGPKIMVPLDAAVEFTQKFAAVPRIVFPGIFAIQE